MLNAILTTVAYAGIVYCGLLFVLFVIWFSAFSLGGE